MLLRRNQTAVQAGKRFKCILSLGLCLLLTAVTLCPFPARAEKAQQKTVRVGWYESTYCYRDKFGRRKGVAYEYQQKVAAHTGWKYEYVEDSWPNLLQKLMDGEIDLLSDVSYKKERTGHMLYSALAMGAESYYLYIDSENTEITPENLSSLNGKKIGVNKGSFQEGLLRNWAEQNDLSVNIVELTDDETYFMTMLANGDIDALVSMDNLGSEKRVVPVCKIGASDYFFAVNKQRPDLLNELNSALSAIQDEDPYYNQNITKEAVSLMKTNAFATPAQESWLEAHGTIRVGYWDNYLPFCAADKKTGELTGALKDYLNQASNCLKNANIRFEAVPYPSTDAALAAMKDGKIDCVFPVNLSTFEGEERGVLSVNPIMRTEMSLLMRSEERLERESGQTQTVAIDAGNSNFETFVKDDLPDWTIQSCPTMEDCFRSVKNRTADGVLACTYRMNVYEPMRIKYKLVAVPTGETMELTFAVRSDNHTLFSILDKIVNLTPEEDMQYALSNYLYTTRKISFVDFLEDNWIAMMVAISAVFFLIIFLLVQKLKAERKANEQQRLLEEAAEIVKLKQTISSLLDNMPGMNYTKDAQPGAYLACNLAFASFARKKTPEEVVGLTAAEIFDEETAKRYQEDDKMALSMDEPYIFFEDTRDPEGERRQIKTTKLKYTDAAGRLCVLGNSVDVTMDMVRIHRGSVSSPEDYESARRTGIIYAHIAQALAQGYTDLYYINLDTEGYIEYRTDENSGTLAEIRRGWHFFEQCQIESEQVVYVEDREAVQKALHRKTLVAELERSNTFIMTYRLNGKKGPFYVNMTVTRMKDDERYIIMGVTDVDEQMKQRLSSQRAKEERIAYARLNALTGDFLCVYVVVPESGFYREYSESSGLQAFSLPKEGTDFFGDSAQRGRNVIYHEDLDRFLAAFTAETVLGDIERHGIFSMTYRLMMNGKPRYVQLKAAMVVEKEGPRLVVGINDIDAQVRQEEAYARNLAQARIEATIDSLTHVKNRHAYRLAEEELNRQIQASCAPDFAVVVLDVNDLKKVNDTSGHEAGDELLRSACKVICEIFKHSPVFRIGGDEFAVISKENDYACMEQLIERVAAHNLEAQCSGGVVIACGMSKFEGDESVSAVFERADQSMYENKSELKKRKAAAQT